MKKYLKIEKQVEDSIEFTLLQNNELEISIESPWSGDSESGFGQTLRIELTQREILLLRNFLTTILTPADRQ